MEIDPRDHDPLPYLEDAYRAQLEGDGGGGAQLEGDGGGGAQLEGDGGGGGAQLEGDGGGGGARLEGEREGRFGNAPHPAGWWERNWGWVALAVGAGIVIVGGVAVYSLYRRVQRLEGSLSALGDHSKYQSMAQHSVIKNALNLSQCQKSIESLKQEVKGVKSDLSLCQKSIESLKQELVPRIERNSRVIKKVDKMVLDIDGKLINTQWFIVDMAKRQKWPWPFNNRVHGLEEEFGLPKK